MQYKISVFQIGDIIFGSVHWITDPDLDLDLDSDPAHFVGCFKMQEQKKVLSKILLLIIYCTFVHQSSRITSH
jgi:hypothetical protein